VPGEQLGTAGVCVREQLRGQAVELVEAGTDAALREALSTQDRIELRGEFRDLLQAHAMDFVGRQAGGGRLRQRGGIDRIAVGDRPDAGGTARRGPQRAQQSDLAIERRIDLGRDDPGSACLPIPGDLRGASAAGQRLDELVVGRAG
jgi:hypothetical protein